MRQARRRAATVRALGLGVASAFLYAGLFTHQDLMMDYCTRGGAFAFLPGTIALCFSLIHGAFASCVFEALGIEAATTSWGSRRG